MLHSHLDPISASQVSDSDCADAVQLQEEITALQNSHSSHYKMMNLNAWAIAKTMDTRFPRFWNRFMENRQVALKQFLEQKRTHQSSLSDVSEPNS